MSETIFSKIIDREIPADIIYEDDLCLAFKDVNPQAPTHVLVIPKAPFVSWDDFSARGTDEQIAAFVRGVGEVARMLGLVEPGYRLLANIGLDAHQEVPHLHVHLFAGKPLGPMLMRG